MLKTKLQTLIAAAVVAIIGFLPASVSAAEFFAGKTITWILPWPAGSGGDLHGRLTAKYMETHIPGNPDIIINNKPGGKGTIALNFVYERASKDGLTYFYGEWNPSAVLEKKPGVRYVPEKMGIVGSMGGDHALMVRYDQVENLKALKDANFIVGGRGATNALEVLGNLGLKVMGAEFRYVGGFGGFSKIQAAIKANEVHAGHAGLPGYVKFFGPDSDIAYPLYYHQLFDVKGNPRPKPEKAYPANVPTLFDAHKTLYGKEPSGDYWAAYKWWMDNIMSAGTAVLSPPEIPEEPLKVMQDAFAAVSKDKVYLKEYEESIGVPPPFNSVEKTRHILDHYTNMPANIKKVIAEISSL